MKVSLVCEQLLQSVPGGIGVYLSGLIKGLSQVNISGLDLSLMSSGPMDSHQDINSRFDQTVIAQNRLVSKSIHLLWTHSTLRFPGRFAVGSDVVHAPSFVYPRLAASSLVVVVHDLTWKKYPEAFTRHGVRWHDKALKRSIELASGFIVPSSQTQEDLHLELERHKRNIPIRLIEWGADHVAPGAVAPGAVAPGAVAPGDSEANRGNLKEYGITKPYFITLGTLEPRKNLSRIIEAFCLANRRIGYGLQLLVVGPKGWGNIKVASPSIDESVIFAGKVSDFARDNLLRQSFGCLYVPLQEGWGFPVVEAMKCGVPVISSDVPSASGGSFKVDPTSIEEISQAIVDFYSDVSLREKYIGLGNSRVSELTWEKCARRHVSVWEEFRG